MTEPGLTREQFDEIVHRHGGIEDWIVPDIAKHFADQDICPHCRIMRKHSGHPASCGPSFGSPGCFLITDPDAS